MTLHRTPVHATALRMVRERQVEWRPEIGVSGGFTKPEGEPIADLSVLIALWQLLRSELITVDGGVVLLTKAGRRRLAEWSGARAGRSS